MRKVAILVVLITVAMSGTAFAVLDCPRVKQLHGEGQRPADIARALGVTTPEVQECMAGEVEEPAPSAASVGDSLRLAPNEIPSNENPVPRGPNQQ